MEDNINPIIGIIIVLVLVSSTASQGIRDPIALLIVGVLGTILVTLLGLLSSTYLIIMILSMIVIGVLYKTLNPYGN
jgi:hypothetical protein